MSEQTAWITSVREIKSHPNGELTGYLINGNMTAPVYPGNREYENVLLWISEGNTPAAAFTPDELNAFRIQDIENERDRRIDVEVYAVGRSKDLILMQAAALNNKRAQNANAGGGGPSGGLDTAEQARETQLNTLFTRIGAIDSAAQSAIDSGVATVGDITWP